LKIDGYNEGKDKCEDCRPKPVVEKMAEEKEGETKVEKEEEEEEEKPGLG
jgi:hypothetical protein